MTHDYERFNSIKVRLEPKTPPEGVLNVMFLELKLKFCSSNQCSRIVLIVPLDLRIPHQ